MNTQAAPSFDGVQTSAGQWRTRRWRRVGYFPGSTYADARHLLDREEVRSMGRALRAIAIGLMCLMAYMFATIVIAFIPQVDLPAIATNPTVLVVPAMMTLPAAWHGAALMYILQFKGSWSDQWDTAGVRVNEQWRLLGCEPITRERYQAYTDVLTDVTVRTGPPEIWFLASRGVTPDQAAHVAALAPDSPLGDYPFVVSHGLNHWSDYLDVVTDGGQWDGNVRCAVDLASDCYQRRTAVDPDVTVHQVVALLIAWGQIRRTVAETARALATATVDDDGNPQVHQVLIRDAPLTEWVEHTGDLGPDFFRLGVGLAEARKMLAAGPVDAQTLRAMTALQNG